MKRTWNYAVNTFLNATKTNFKKMLGLVSYHLTALNAEKDDPEILALFNASKTELETYKTKYAAWNGAKGDLAGETQLFNDCLDLMSDKLDGWDLNIQQVYREKTGEYKSIFNKGKTGFYTGTQDERISELDTLELQLKKHPSLDTVRASVKTYKDELKGYKENKEQYFEKLDKASVELEKSRIVVGIRMYRNLGMLMYKFGETPEEIVRFFNLELLRRHLSKTDDSENQSYVLFIDPKTTEEAGISFEENAKFNIFNNSNAKVGVYAATENPATPPTQMMILESDEEKTTSLVELNGQNCRFLFFVNLDEHEEAEIEIIMVEE